MLPGSDCQITALTYSTQATKHQNDVKKKFPFFGDFWALFSSRACLFSACAIPFFSPSFADFRICPFLFP